MVEERPLAGDEHGDPDTSSGLVIGRRQLLKLAGIVITPLAFGEARGATSTEYGAGEYGSGSYGGSNAEPVLAVQSTSATDVTTTSATLTGELLDMGGAASVDVSFEWWGSGTATVTETDVRTLSSAGSFSVPLDGLAGSTTYEFRALATASDGDSAAGTVATVTTPSASDSPVVDRFEVLEAGSPNPHAELSVDWAVSDADGDLASGLVVVLDASGSTVSTTRLAVSGSSAAGRETIKIKHGGNTTYEVRIDVTDATDASATRTSTVRS